MNYPNAERNEYNMYPVVVYTQPVLDIAGGNTFLQHKMDEILETPMPNFKIHALTLVHRHHLLCYRHADNILLIKPVHRKCMRSAVSTLINY